MIAGSERDEIILGCEVLSALEYSRREPAVTDPEALAAAVKNDALPIAERALVLRWRSLPGVAMFMRCGRERPTDEQILNAHAFLAFSKAAGWSGSYSSLCSLMGMPA